MSISTRKLAQLAGVSAVTVSRAVRRLDGMNEQTRRKILAPARKHHFPLPAPFPSQ